MTEKEVEAECLPETQEGLEPLPRYAKNGRAIGVKYQAFRILRQAGLGQTLVASLLGLSRGSGTKIERKLAKKYDLTSVSHVRLADRAIRRVLAGEPVKARNTALDKGGNLVEINKDVYPRPADQLEASRMIYDRVQPLKREESELDENVVFTEVNIEVFKSSGTPSPERIEGKGEFTQINQGTEATLLEDSREEVKEASKAPDSDR